jgi:hypothetical protein
MRSSAICKQRNRCSYHIRHMATCLWSLNLWCCLNLLYAERRFHRPSEVDVSNLWAVHCTMCVFKTVLPCWHCINNRTILAFVLLKALWLRVITNTLREPEPSPAFPVFKKCTYIALLGLMPVYQMAWHHILQVCTLNCHCLENTTSRQVHLLDC